MEGGVLGLYPPPSQNPGILSPMYSAGSCHPLRAPRLRLQLVGFLPASAPMDITGSFEAIPHPPYLPVTPFSLAAPKGRAGPGPRCSAGSPEGPLSIPKCGSQTSAPPPPSGCPNALGNSPTLPSLFVLPEASPNPLLGQHPVPPHQ